MFKVLEIQQMKADIAMLFAASWLQVNKRTHMKRQPDARCASRALSKRILPVDSINEEGVGAGRRKRGRRGTRR